MTPEDVLQRVRATGLLAPDRPVVAMLSGGRDSVCLLDVLVGVCGAHSVHALHVNYRLRPESDAEEAHCRDLCQRLTVALEVVRAGGREGFRAGNLQAWARALRYEAAEALAERLDEARGIAGHSTAMIAAGHTATDQVETILYRLAASPGRRALLGMSPRDGRLVRPLLEITREHTAAYCRARGLDWREDPSNDSEQYARARVRNQLLPALDAVHPAARENVLRTARLLREEAVVLDAIVDAELERDSAVAEGGPGGRDGGHCGEPGVAIERLRDLPPAVARLIVVRLAEYAAGTYVPQAGARVEEILALADRSSIGRGGRAELHVGGLVGAVIERGRLRMVRLPPR